MPGAGTLWDADASFPPGPLLLLERKATWVEQKAPLGQATPEGARGVEGRVGQEVKPRQISLIPWKPKARPTGNAEGGWRALLLSHAAGGTAGLGSGSQVSASHHYIH